MPSLTHEELTGLTSSQTWKKVIDELEIQKNALMERVCFGLSRDTVEKTAMDYIEAATEVRMYDEFIHLDELLFGRRENEGEGND